MSDPNDDLQIPPFLKRTPDMPVVGSASLAPPPPPVQAAPPPPPVAPPAPPAGNEMPSAPAPAVGQVDITKRVGQYVKLRDKIDEIKKKQQEELRPYVEARAALDALLLEQLRLSNTTSMKTMEGTISALDKVSCSVEDAETFRNYITTNQDWDLADWRANSTAVQAYLEVNQSLPPGVKMSTFRTLGVRRSS